MQIKINMIRRKVHVFFLVPAIIAGVIIGYLLSRQAKGRSDVADAQVADAERTEYTCAMHPQIRQSGPGICPLCEMDLTPVQTGTGQDDRVLTMTPEAVQLSNIQTMQVGIAAPSSGKSLRLSGKIKADERRAAIQAAHLPGRIEALFVTFTGEKVQKGQALARIYSPALVNAQRELLEAIRLQGTGSELAEAARNKIRAWKIPEDFLREVEGSGKIQRESLLRADRSGYVIAKKVTVGDYVEEGMPVLELMDLQKVWVVLEAYEADLPMVRVGSRVEISTPAAPGRVFPATVTFIDPILNAASRTVAVRAELQNAQGLFKPEMLVEAVLRGTSGSNQAGLTVPGTAVLWTGKRSVVYVKVPDAPVPSFEFREVELGEASDEGYQVRSGLEPGEQVVVEGAFVIDAAAQLNNQSSMMHRMVSNSMTEKISVPDFRQLMAPTFKNQWGRVIREYLALKDALVATDRGAASRSARIFLEALNGLEYQQQPWDLRQFVQKNAGPLKATARAVETAKYVEAQRQQFLYLSERMIQCIRTMGAGGQTLYVQHCPMAFNNQGGDWVSAERPVLNPYFGDEMLHCGIVKDSL
jgi:Cu(I)/Ag(I) efflux system membrane fusion protein